MEKALGVVKLIRPVNCIVMGFAVAGIVVSIQGFPLTKKTIINILLSFTTGFAFLAAANAINDYSDRDIDAINEPARPIPSGIIRPKEALICASILSAVGFATAFLTSVLCLFIATLGWILSMFYVHKGKRTGLLGNFIVSVCIAFPFIYGGFVVKRELNIILIVYAIIAFLSNMGREITKGVVDIEGDRLNGIKTTAVLYGSRTAAVTAVFFYFASITFSFFPWILRKVSALYLPLVVLADGGFVLSSFSLLLDHSRKNAKRVKRLVLVWMVIGLLAFVVGNVISNL